YSLLSRRQSFIKRKLHSQYRCLGISKFMQTKIQVYVKRPVENLCEMVFNSSKNKCNKKKNDQQRQYEYEDNYKYLHDSMADIISDAIILLQIRELRLVLRQ